MKKKIAAVILAAALSATLMACGSSSSDEVRPASSVDANVEEEIAEIADEEEVADTEESGKDSSSGSVTIEETELYNANGITVTATKIDEDTIWGPEIAVLITNDSDQNVIVTTRNLTVNGYMMNSSGLYAEVASGKSANDELSIYSSDLDECGIETIATIEFNIHIEDSSTWEDLDDGDRITINTSAEPGFTQPVDDNGDVIYNANDIRLVCKGIKNDSIWDGELVFFAENNSNQSISIYSENVSVNGFMEDSSFWIDLCPDTKAVDGMYLYDLDDLNLESVEDISEIEFNLRIVDADTWDTIDTSDVITLHFDSAE